MKRVLCILVFKNYMDEAVLKASAESFLEGGGLPSPHLPLTKRIYKLTIPYLVTNSVWVLVMEKCVCLS